MKRYLLAILFVFCVIRCSASAPDYHYTYTENCRKAYQHYLSLHIADARSCLLIEIKADPYNLLAVYISDYEDCILLLLNCSKSDLKQRADHLSEHIDLLDKGDQSSPWYRFCKAGVYLHWAIINMRFGEQYNTANYFRKSFALLKENQKLFPQFEYNNTFFGLEEAVVGSLPGNYKWLASIFGMKGNVRNGTGKLNAFIGSHNNNNPFYAETVLYALYTRFYLLPEQKEVWDFLNSKSFSTNNNLLNTYVKANLALDLRKSDEAIQILKVASVDASFGLYPVFDYQMGCALYNQCDTASAYYFNSYLKKNKSDLYIKDCWQRMSLIWYLAGDLSKASYCRSQISKNGTARIDADKQAQKFVETGIWPNKILLRSRLLIEAGYYNKAFSTLATIDNNVLSNPTDKAEYYFRMGRIYEETDNFSKAIEYYQYTINTGKERHEQFAARAALQMGKMYERSNKPTPAMQRYKECLQMPYHDFQNSIDQQAKAGINRLEGK